MKFQWRTSCVLIVLAGISSASLAKLPAPSPEARAKADEAKAKAVWADKLAAFQLCKVQDKVAAQYLKAKGGQPAAGTPPCSDPGPYVAAAPAPAASAAAVKP